MSISLALVYGLAILLPGFFFYGSIFTPLTGKNLYADSPSPSSILTVFILGLGACLGHILGTVLVVANHFLAEFFGNKFTVPFNPDFYQTLQNLGTASTIDLSCALIFLIIVSLLTFVLGSRLERRFPSYFRHMRFGQYAPIMMESSDDEGVVIGYVLTHETQFSPTTKKHNHVGYEGIVINLGHDKTGTKYVHLVDATLFVLEKRAGQIVKKDLRQKEPIPYLYVAQGEIKNIALEIIHITS